MLSTLRILIYVALFVVTIITPVASFGQGDTNTTSGNCSPIINVAENITINCRVGDTVQSITDRHNRLLEKIKTNTPITFIIQEMGQPSQVGQLDNNLKIMSWDSLNFQLFYILEEDSPRAIGIFSTSDELIKIPLLGWEGRDHLNQIYLGEVDCDPDQIVEGDARYGYGSLSSCYEGAGGSYLDWEFVFSGFFNCLEIESWVLSRLAEDNCTKQLTPIIAIAHLYNANDESDFWSSLKLAALVSDFYFWGR